MLTKGKMIKELKRIGVRKGNKDNAIVSLEHLKSYQITNLYAQHFDITQKF